VRTIEIKFKVKLGWCHLLIFNRTVMKMISLRLSVIFFIYCVSGFADTMGQGKAHVLKLSTPEDLHAFFAFTGTHKVIISGHRGGIVPGFPENSVATFENTLKYTPAFFEIDPRLTKDSVIVLMHDATLDRTTTGKGKLADYNYSELAGLRLRDAGGKVTGYKIPTLSEVIEWARGKTILNLDHKDVPLWMIAALIKKHKAEAFVMITVHKPEEAVYYLTQNRKSMFSAFIRNRAELEAYEKAGVPFTQMIAYIGPSVKPENKELYDMLNKKGTMCMISAAPTYDKLTSVAERWAAYVLVGEDGASILESDLPIEAAEALKDLRKESPARLRFFGVK
jgi:glycerophosphoryl diester phosphodiesterase